MAALHRELVSPWMYVRMNPCILVSSDLPIRCMDVNDVGVSANCRSSWQQMLEAVLECKFLNKDLLSIADDKPHCEAGLQLSCSKCDDIQDRKSAEKNVNTCANSCCDSLLPGDLNQFHIAGRIP